jgi:hypothetical protein
MPEKMKPAQKLKGPPDFFPKSPASPSKIFLTKSSIDARQEWDRDVETIERRWHAATSGAFGPPGNSHMPTIYECEHSGERE